MTDKHGSLAELDLNSIMTAEDDVEESPPVRSAPTQAPMNDRQKRALSKIETQNKITDTAILILKGCVGFLFIAYAFEVVSSFSDRPRIQTGANDLLTVIQYITAGLIGYLFGQNNNSK